MRFTVEGFIDAPRDAVWAWWTDFGSPGETFRMKHGAGSSTRRILDVAKERVVVEDASAIGVVHREVRVGDFTLHETASGGQTFESEWRFDAVAPDRTRVTRSMRLRAHAAYGPFARWVTRMDLRYHCREAERELKRAAATRG